MEKTIQNQRHKAMRTLRCECDVRIQKCSPDCQPTILHLSHSICHIRDICDTITLSLFYIHFFSWSFLYKTPYAPYDIFSSNIPKPLPINRRKYRIRAYNLTLGHTWRIWGLRAKGRWLCLQAQPHQLTCPGP